MKNTILINLTGMIIDKENVRPTERSEFFEIIEGCDRNNLKSLSDASQDIISLVHESLEFIEDENGDLEFAEYDEYYVLVEPTFEILDAILYRDMRMDNLIPISIIGAIDKGLI